MSLHDAVLVGRTVSGIVNTQVDSTKVKHKVVWEIVMCRWRFPNSCKCPALMEGGGSQEGTSQEEGVSGASQEAGVLGRGGVCILLVLL